MSESILKNASLHMNNRKEVFIILKELYARGYRYVVRDLDMPYLVCFSEKPKRYREMESWGYPNVEIPGILMAYPVKNIDIEEINWKNRSATHIQLILS